MGTNSFVSPKYAYVIFNAKGEIVGVFSSIKEATIYTIDKKGYTYETFTMNDLLKR